MDRGSIEAIVLDVDGVLTDGRLYYSENGECMKVFYVQDGSAIKAWQRQGGKVAFLSGRESPVVEQRARELGVTEVVQGTDDKLEPFKQIIERWRLRADQVCYVGDDLADLAPMQACGFAVAVGNAVGQVKSIADYVTRSEGGAGAAREVIELLLVERNR